MNFDKRFYGVYEGIVVDTADPENRGRVKLQVPQVTGFEETGWAAAITGGISQNHMPYITVSSSSNESVTAANTATLATFQTVEDSNKINLVDNSKLQVLESGDYFFQFSGQFSKTGGSSAQADIWVRKNGVDIPRSNSRVTFSGNPNEVLVCVSFILDLDKNDYVQLYFSSADSGVKLTTHTGLTNPVRPDIPAVIATLNLIGKYKPQPGEKVGVMYIAGDPNFPLWIGEIA
jgi:hypothetical protein